jgi:hypothetical protein
VPRNIHLEESPPLAIVPLPLDTRGPADRMQERDQRLVPCYVTGGFLEQLEALRRPFVEAVGGRSSVWPGGRTSDPGEVWDNRSKVNHPAGRLLVFPLAYLLRPLRLGFFSPPCSANSLQARAEVLLQPCTEVIPATSVTIVVATVNGKRTGSTGFDLPFPRLLRFETIQERFPTEGARLATRS